MHGSRSTLYLQYDFDKDDDSKDDDDDNDDEDDYSCNSVNFQARTSRFCIEVDLHKTYNMILIKMMIMTMMMIIMMKMMKIIIALTQAIFKLGPPDFTWKYIHIIPRI